MVQWATLITVRTRKLSMFQRGLLCGGDESNPVLAFGLVFVLAPAWVVYHRDGLGREEARRDESEPGAHELEAAE